jgi:type II secretory pathway component GspD/PulD (secretin)
MRQELDAAGRKRQRSRRTTIAAAALVLGSMLPTAAWAQQDQNASEGKYRADNHQTIFLEHAATNGEANDIVQALRNAMPHAAVYLNPSAQAISISATAADVALAQKIVAEMDKPARVYRLTYTLTQMEDGKRSGSQQFAIVVASGDHASFKQGTRVPILTGSFDKDSNSKESQVQYMDIGLGIEAKADGFQDGVKVASKLEETSVGDEHSGFGAQDPVIHQTSLNQTSVLALGKPMALGSLDVPGTTRRMEVEVVAELVK